MFRASFIFTLLLGTTGAWANADEPLRTREVNGEKIFTTVDGRTVYTFDHDDRHISNCYDDCAKEWPPVLASRDLFPPLPYGLSPRRDGTFQLTLEAKPLYLYAKDQAPGDTRGNGIDDLWHVVRVEDTMHVCYVARVRGLADASRNQWFIYEGGPARNSMAETNAEALATCRQMSVEPSSCSVAGHILRLGDECPPRE